MLYKKYIMLSAICFVTLAHGAASSSSIIHVDQDDHSSGEVEHLLPRTIATPDSIRDYDLSAVEIPSLVRIETVQVPGESNIIHMPFVSGWKERPNLLEAAYYRSTSHIYRLCAGIVSGSHPEGVAAMAKAAGAVYKQAHKEDEFLYEGFSLQEKVKRSVIAQNPELSEFVRDCQLLYRGTSMNRYKHVNTTAWVLLPKDHRLLAHSISSSKKFASADELATAIKAAAAGMCRATQERDPLVRLVSIPMLVSRQDSPEFHQEAYPKKTN